MSQMSYRWLADENFPFPALRVLQAVGWDISHIGIKHSGLADTAVMQMAITEDRILLTFDGDHGTLVFKDGFRPVGIVYFRLTNYSPDSPGHLLIKLVQDKWTFLGFITVIENELIRQRPIPASP